MLPAAGSSPASTQTRRSTGWKSWRSPKTATSSLTASASSPHVQARSRRNWMQDAVREVRIATESGTILRILSNDLDASARKSYDLYRRRWAIELFFRWVKQTLVSDDRGSCHCRRQCFGRSDPECAAAEAGDPRPVAGPQVDPAVEGQGSQFRRQPCATARPDRSRLASARKSRRSRRPSRRSISISSSTTIRPISARASMPRRRNSARRSRTPA